MRILLDKDVYQAALDRLRYLFDEFDEIIVNFSGGKDSTVVLNLALEVAREKNKLPLKVFFLDQEAEWEMVIDYIREVFDNDEIEPIWLQVPIVLFNATSNTDTWLRCWGKGEDWMRDREPNSVHINRFGTERFSEMFEAYNKKMFPDKTVARIAGVRTEESPARALGLTTYATYKHITWGKKEDVKRGHYTFYPIYDWSMNDVWKAIHDNKWSYCKLYDYMYRYGIGLRDMRVSNVHHETAVKVLYFLQEIEPETWNKLTARLSGVNTAKHLMDDGFKQVKELPYMFKDWKEYRDYLLEKLITDDGNRAKMAKLFKSEEERYSRVIHPELIRMHISSILVNDYHGTKSTTFAASHGRFLKNGKFGEAWNHEK